MSDLDYLQPIIQQSPLLQALAETMPEALSEALHEEYYHAETVLFRQGDPGDRLYAILEGRLRVQLDQPGDDPPIHIGDRFPGETVGEMSILEDAPRSATVVVVEDARLLCLARDDFGHLIAQQPDAAFAIMRSLSRRLRASDDLLVETSRAVEALSRRVTELILGGTETEVRPLGFAALLLGDLRAPLENILDGVRTLKVAQPEIAGIVVPIDINARRLLSVVNGVADLTWLESGVAYLDRHPLALGDIFADLIDRFQPVVHPLNIRLRLEAEPNLPTVLADKQWLERACFNLLNYTIERSPTGSDVWIALSHDDQRGLTIARITDHGEAPDEFTRARLFEPFTIVPETGEVQANLPLASARAAIIAHEGQMWVEEGPSPRVGITITLALPVA